MVTNAGIVGLQAAVMDPAICKGIILLNISLRMLHIKKQPWYGRPIIKSFQNLLRWISFFCISLTQISFPIYIWLVVQDIFAPFLVSPGILLLENSSSKLLLRQSQ